MNEIQIITPAGMLGSSDADDAIDTAMRVIGIGFAGPDEWATKYGTDYENDVFMMHRYCWCDREDCPWCAGCDCPQDSQHFFVDGIEVTSTAYMDFYTQQVGPHPSQWEGPEYEAFAARGNAANERRSTRHDPVCKFCTGEPFPTSGAIKGKSAPNFWFKPTGYRLWWYKYIGRSMEGEGNLPSDFLQQIFATHPTGMTAEQAFEKMADYEEESAKAFAKLMADINGAFHSG